jgi:hypothetical protein
MEEALEQVLRRLELVDSMGEVAHIHQADQQVQVLPGPCAFEDGKRRHEVAVRVFQFSQRQAMSPAESKGMAQERMRRAQQLAPQVNRPRGARDALSILHMRNCA